MQYYFEVMTKMACFLICTDKILFFLLIVVTNTNMLFSAMTKVLDVIDSLAG